MATIVRTPFDGKPATSEFVDASGKRAFLVRIWAPTPGDVMTADFVSYLSIPHSWLLLSDKAANVQFDAFLVIYLVIVTLLLRPVYAAVFRLFLKSRTRVALTETTIEVRYAGQREIFDRQIPHRFVLIPHDKAQDEREEHDYEKQRASAAGGAFRPKRYYTQSFIICLDYLGQRKDIVAVFGAKEAQDILARLIACDSLMDGQVQKGKGTVLNPADEWSEQPGDIEELA